MFSFKTVPGQKLPGQKKWFFFHYQDRNSRTENFLLSKLYQDRNYQDRKNCFWISLPGQKQQDRDFNFFEVSTRTEITRTEKMVFGFHQQDRTVGQKKLLFFELSTRTEITRTEKLVFGIHSRTGQ